MNMENIRDLLGNWILQYIVVLIFATSVAYGSFDYYARTSNVTIKMVKSFFSRLAIPSKYMVYLFPFKQWEKYAPQEKWVAMSRRTFSSVPILLYITIIFRIPLIRALYERDSTETLLGTLGIGLCIVSLIWS